MNFIKCIFSENDYAALIFQNEINGEIITHYINPYDIDEEVPSQDQIDLEKEVKTFIKKKFK